MGTGQHLLARAGEHNLGVLGHRASDAVDVTDDVLDDGRRSPQELAGGAVEGIDDTGLARDTGHHPSGLTWP